MALTGIAVSILVLCVAFMVFTITIAAPRAINEYCTQEMVWDGNR